MKSNPYEAVIRQLRWAFVLLIGAHIFAAVAAHGTAFLWSNVVVATAFLILPCSDPLFGNKGRLYWVRQTGISFAILANIVAYSI